MKSFSKDKHSKSGSIKAHLAKKNQHQYHYKLQQEIATEAARLMCEDGMDDIHSARQKAAQKLGVYDKHFFPDETEVLFQIKTHQLLYKTDSNKQILASLMKTAFNAMKLLDSFEPKLIGSILKGYAHEHSHIDILLRVDSPEDIAVFLMAQKIPYLLGEWKLFSGKAKSKMKNSFQLVPNYQFYADNHRINLIILAERNRKIMPFDPENRQLIQSTSLKQFATLLEPD